MVELADREQVGEVVAGFLRKRAFDPLVSGEERVFGACPVRPAVERRDGGAVDGRAHAADDDLRRCGTVFQFDGKSAVALELRRAEHAVDLHVLSAGPDRAVVGEQAGLAAERGSVGVGHLQVVHGVRAADERRALVDRDGSRVGRAGIGQRAAFHVHEGVSRAKDVAGIAHVTLEVEVGEQVVDGGLVGIIFAFVLDLQLGIVLHLLGCDLDVLQEILQLVIPSESYPEFPYSLPGSYDNDIRKLHS